MSEPAQNNHEFIKLLRHKLSFKQLTEHLVNGYIKENTTKEQQDKYPLSVQQISCTYLGNQIWLKFKSSLTDNSKIKLLNDKHAIVYDIDHIASETWSKSLINTTLLIDSPIPVNNTSINIEWKLKITAPALPNGHYFIGIVLNQFNHFHYTVWGASNRDKSKWRPYGVYGGAVFVRNIAMNTFDDCTVDDSGDENHIGDGFHIKDCLINVSYDSDQHIVFAHYDGELKKLTISKGEQKEFVCTLDLPFIEPDVDDENNNKYWYPAISLRDSDDSVEIL